VFLERRRDALPFTADSHVMLGKAKDLQAKVTRQTRIGERRFMI
jgi:hypothetical protein